MSMKTIPRCPHCGKRVKKIIESQTWTHDIERVSVQFNEWGKHPYTLKADPKGDWEYIADNEGKSFKCARCDGSLNDYFGVMGLYSWRDNVRSCE